MDVPKRWMQIRLDSLHGLVMIIGAPDVGKTTLARYLYEQVAAVHPLMAYIDGDPGQSTLGLPGPITMALSKRGDPSFPPAGARRQYFIGDVSPRAGPGAKCSWPTTLPKPALWISTGAN